MKFIDMCLNVDKSEENSFWVDVSSIAESQFGIYSINGDDEGRLKGYYLLPRYDTDSWVGVCVYYLDDEFVGISTQDGRKCDILYSWRDTVAVEKMKQFCISLIDMDTTLCDILPEEEWQGDTDPTFSVYYECEIVKNTALYGGETVEVKRSRGVSKSVDVELPSGEIKNVPCADLRFTMNLKGDVE